MKKFFSFILSLCMVFTIISGTLTVSAANTTVSAKNYLSGITGLSYVRVYRTYADESDSELKMTDHILEMYDALGLSLSNSGNWSKIVAPIRNAMKAECIFEYTNTDSYGDTEYIYFQTESALVTKYFRILGKTVSQKILNESGLVYIECARLTEFPKDFTNITFLGETYTYDGAEKNLTVKGNIPTSTKVDYTNEKATNVGTYNATAKVTCDGYNDLTLTATLKINPAEISVKANEVEMIKGASIPTLTYTADKLCDGDSFTGALATKADGKNVGTFDITQGTLTAGNNYKINFTKGTLTVSDKTPQVATVSAMPEKTYGDSGFKVEVTNDQNSDLGKFTFESSNTDVATIDESGNVTIKNAGDTNIIVKRSGNDTYADFEKSQKLTVKKVAITVNADAKSKRVGTADPELTYTYTGTLVGEDKFTGTLTREQGETVGKYDILIGTLDINKNYDITYNKAIFEILEKTPQTITVADFGEKTYGDTAFAISVTPDTTSNLSNFTYVSDNENVATISAIGEITIVGAGEANISVTEAGNDDYAKTTVTKKLTVAKKSVSVTSIDLENKTAVLDGVLTGDTEVELDFDKINIEIVSEATETTSNVLLKNLILKGEKAINYNVTTESVAGVIENGKIVEITVTAENGTVNEVGKYLKGSTVALTATPNNGYRFDGWYNSDTQVSTDSTYTLTASENTVLTAKFSFIPVHSGGGGSSVTTYAVKFETNGGSEIDSVRVGKNKTVEEPTAPTKDGFEFAGWYTDKGLKMKYNFSEKVTKSFTLYAGWTEKKAEVKDDNTEPTEPTTPETKITFTDVKENDWFAKSVKYVFENGLMNGTTATEFAPNDNLTRAMLVTILYRAESEPTVDENTDFTDVTADGYYANAVIWAQQNGIVSGVNENEFAPDENITREQIATIIYKYAKFKGYDTSAKADISSLTDADEISEYATEGMQYAVGSGLIKGKTETTLNPKDNATRAEIATILQRFIEANK